MMSSDDASQQDACDKGKERFVIPSEDSDGVWEEGDPLSDVEEISVHSPSDSDENDSDEYEVIEEDPFEPVYASPSAEAEGIAIEAVSLENILPEGSRRRM